MKSRPILFNAAMVRAILDGRKTQTRRIVKPQPGGNNRITKGGRTINVRDPKIAELCSYGIPGDQLWVLENFGFSYQDDDINGLERVVVYQAGHPFHVTDAGVDALKRCQSGSLMQPNHFVRPPSRWRPSIHMPRWASRITLEIAGVRVERLQDISEEDAKAEGVEQTEHGWRNYLPGTRGMDEDMDDPRWSYSSLWESINGPGSWEANPWVWVVDFKRAEARP